jgi:hypothetical protein
MDAGQEYAFRCHGGTRGRAVAQSRIRVIFAEGRDLANLSRILAGGHFVGTTIGPE